MCEPPHIDGELYRILLAHRSLGVVSSPDWGDNERLAVIGKRVAPLVIADILSKQRPMLTAVELEVRCHN